jgi:hypothetical protein
MKRKKVVLLQIFDPYGEANSNLELIIVQFSDPCLKSENLKGRGHLGNVCGVG